jgi:hypothetical protein
MTTQQLDRPLSQVDETAESVRASTPDDWSRSTDERPTPTQWLKETIARVAQDPGPMLVASIVAVALVIVLAALWGRRRPPRTAQDVLLERSREAFDRARESLEAMASKLASVER